MTTIELKNNFHQLIESIDNLNLLQQFYELMLRKKTSKDGKLWATLSEEEKDELLIANEECENPDNLIPNDEIKKQYAKWL
jgi:hypothetical protein